MGLTPSPCSWLWLSLFLSFRSCQFGHPLKLMKSGTTWHHHQISLWPSRQRTVLSHVKHWPVTTLVVIAGISTVPKSPPRKIGSNTIPKFKGVGGTSKVSNRDITRESQEHQKTTLAQLHMIAKASTVAFSP